MTVATRFRYAGVILVRAATDPGDLDLPHSIDLDDAVSVHQDGLVWLAKVWACAGVRDAVGLASAGLARRVEHHLAGGAVPAFPELRRVIVSVASYLARWQRRATPFGVFAAVTTASLGPAVAEVGTEHRAIARADAAWVSTVVDRLERERELRARLTVVADTALIIRDGRAIVHKRAAATTGDPGPVRESSIRLTRPVEFALAAATTPIRFADLTARLAARFPAASPSKVGDLVHGLVDGGVLVTNLRAPATTIDALAHLIAALRAAEVGDLPDVAAVLDQLTAIHTALARHNALEERGQARAIRQTLPARMIAVAPVEPVLAIDTRLDVRVVIPERVVAEAALAASVLLRTATQPFGTTAWLDYHARFLARYGPGALVPVRDVLAESGLGYPSGYLGAPRARPAWRVLTERDAALSVLIQQAAVSGAAEIMLTDADIDALTVGDHADLVVPQRIELGVILDAVSTAAINRGDYTLRITATPRVPTSMAGRFTYLLDEPDRACLAATYATDQDDTVAVQLSFAPRRPRNENVTRVPALLSDVVSLSEHPDPDRTDLRLVDLDDLAVTADTTQMYLVQRSTSRRVLPRIPHALDTRVHMPPIARFLAEVADARTAVLRGFDLGSSRTLPYVPRIRYRRTVLLSARWLLSPADLPAKTGFVDALVAWRRRWRVPARVVLHHGEIRLPLDLDRPFDQTLLRAHLHRADRVVLHEDSPPGSGAWIACPAELLIPMTALDPPPRRLPIIAAPGTMHRPGHSAMLHAQLVGNPARFDEIITAHLPRLATTLGALVTRWWVHRHRDLIHPDTDQHVGIVLRLTDPAQYGTAAAIVADFAADLAARGLPGHLTLAPHHEHPARYGTGPAWIAAEHVFAADTTAARAQLTAATQSGIAPQAWAAASMARLAAAFAPDPITGWQTLLTCLPQHHGRQDRDLREHAITLADDDHTVRALPGGTVVADAWTARAHTLSAYHGVLAEQRDPRGVLRTLLHEHHVRAVGVDPTVEKDTGRLARAAAHRRLALAGAL